MREIISQDVPKIEALLEKVFSDKSYRELSRLGVKLSETPKLLRDENAYSVARVGEQMYLSGECVTDSALQPTYLRAPQAERERLERLKAENK